MSKVWIGTKITGLDLATFGTLSAKPRVNGANKHNTVIYFLCLQFILYPVSTKVFLFLGVAKIFSLFYLDALCSAQTLLI